MSKGSIIKTGATKLRDFAKDLLGTPEVKRYGAYEGDAYAYKMSEVYRDSSSKSRILGGSGTTATWTTYVSPKALTRIPGANNEHLNPNLMNKDSVKWLKRGTNVNKAGPVQAVVGPKGERFIYEGNTRTRVAVQKNQPYVATRVTGVVHGERTIGKQDPLRPIPPKTAKLKAALAKPRASKPRGGKPMKGSK